MTHSTFINTPDPSPQAERNGQDWPPSRHRHSIMVKSARIVDQPGVIGVKMKPRWGDFSVADTRLLGPICETLTARNRILLTQISQLFHTPTGDQVGYLVRLLRAFPKLKGSAPEELFDPRRWQARSAS